MTIRSSYGPPRTKFTFLTSIIAAMMIVCMLLAQLFAYEDFSIVLSSITSSNDSRLLTIMAAGIVLSELMSIPYLLGMYISKLMRALSATLAAGVAGFWLLSALTNAHAENVGFFSTTVTIPGGLIAAAWSLVLSVCVCRVVFADSRFRHVTPLR